MPMSIACPKLSLVTLHVKDEETHVNGPETFLHVVRGYDVGNVGKSVEEAVFVAKGWCWSDDGGLGEYVPGDFFS